MKPTVAFVQTDRNLEHQVERFWKLEASEMASDCEESLSLNDRKAVNIWKESLTQKDGHYEMAIPFKERPPNLPNTYIFLCQK